MKMRKIIKHTFVICAYKESPYLRECIESLKSQSLESNIIMVTSTPCVYLSDIAEEYRIPLFVNEGEGGITQDWNFGLSLVETKLATIAHQDDVYDEHYTEEFIKALKGSKKPIIIFSDYGEIRNGKKTTDVDMLKIKRLMLKPIIPRIFRGSRFVRRRILSMGDPICCPSVMYAMQNLKQPVFDNHFVCCEDWEAWEKLSRMRGDFIYIPKPLMYHRIHEESTTSKTLEAGGRIEENYEMFCKFWPAPIAKAINKFYTKSEDSNDLSEEVGE
ncbi:MAG: glycosyltransferase [Eubacterium sp.]|nr:glycosyltransferase [Eubacterium sp.]